jgi:hypothetical protein
MLEQISVAFYPDASLVHLSVTHPPQPGGNPVQGSLTDRREFSTWASGDRDPDRTIVTASTHIPYQFGRSRLLTRQETTTTTYSRDANHTRYRSQVTTKIEVLTGVGPGKRYYTVTETVTTYAGPDDTVGTSTTTTTPLERTVETTAQETGDRSTENQGDGKPAPSTSKQSCLDEAVSAGKVQSLLQGDGKSTSSCTLILISQSDKDQTVRIPAFQTFVPSGKSTQIMMSTEERSIVVPAGKTAKTELPTVCVSSKIVAPPSAEPTIYKPAEHPNRALKNLFVNILLATNNLEMKHAYEALPLPPTRRARTIAQLAIWRESGALTADSADDVTNEVIKKELLESANLTPESLSKSQQKQLNEGVSSIFAAVDLTCKNARKSLSMQSPAVSSTRPAMQGLPEQPALTQNTGGKVMRTLPEEDPFGDAPAIPTGGVTAKE